MIKCEKCGKDVTYAVKVIVGNKETEELRNGNLEHHYPQQLWCISCMITQYKEEKTIIDTNNELNKQKIIKKVNVNITPKQNIKQNTTFDLTDDQEKQYHDFAKEHSSFDEDNIHYAGAVGGNISIIFTPTSLGYLVRLRCSSCKAELDISDTDNW